MTSNPERGEKGCVIRLFDTRDEDGADWDAAADARAALTDARIDGTEVFFNKQGGFSYRQIGSGGLTRARRIEAEIKKEQDE